MTQDIGSVETSMPERASRRAEFLTFVALAFGVWPFVAVAFVGGYGFLVWMFQLAFGPPGPPTPH